MIFLFLFNISQLFLHSVKKSLIKLPSTMVKSFVILSLILVACDEIPNEVIEQSKIDIKVKSVIAPISFSYSNSDSLLLTRIEFEDSKSIKKVWLKIISVDGITVISSSSEMFDNGNSTVNGDQKANDNIYSAKVGVSKKFSNGKYQIQYFVQDNLRTSTENTIKVAVHIFDYNNNQVSYPPVISDLSIPSSVNRGESFIFTVKVTDQNGLGDISQVYFKLFRPDGSFVDPQNGLGYFLMVDNGDLNLGDQTADDGTYSFKNSFGTTSQTGIWKFEFQAKDKSGNLSNIIIHNMTVN